MAARAQKLAGHDTNSYDLPFKFTGTINKLTVKLGPPQMAAADQKAVDEMKKKVDS